MIKSLKTENRFVTFQIGEGNTECRVSYAGDHAWRLQSKRPGSESFEDEGACQALARALGEELPGKEQELVAETVRGGIALTAPDGSRLQLRLGADELRVYSPSGRLAVSVTGAWSEGRDGCIRGRLRPEDAVFGGGERFNTSNHRGKTLDLYSSDGWNNDYTTYVTVPVFAFSSGGGFFCNRNERMTADLGETEPSVWSVKAQNAPVDCYLIASDRIEDVIAAYTALSGRAALPKPWMQGVMITRYWADFSTFDKDRTDLPPSVWRDGAPTGRSVVTIVDGFMKAGMKPDSVVLEAFPWWQITRGTPEDNARLEELQKSIDYCNARGIKVMVYLQVGKIFGTCAGLKDEYILYANITNTNEDGTATVTRTHEVPRTSRIGNPDAVGSECFNYLDITNPEAVHWYFDVIWGQLIRMGIAGIKADFCEDMPETGVTYTLSRDGKPTGARTISYEWHDPSVVPPGSEHHFYHTYFLSRYYKRMNELAREAGKEDGFVLLARGGGIGSQRHPYMWAGDQVRVYAKLKSQLISVVSSGLSGLPYMTYDMAGYRYSNELPYRDTEENRARESEIFTRGVEYTAFITAIESNGTVRNAYEMTEPAQEIYRIYTGLHHDLIPYIQELSRESSATGLPGVRHLVFHAPRDRRVYEIDDQFMLGDAFLVAPELLGKDSRDIYLPAGDWQDLGSGRIHRVCRGKHLKGYKVPMTALPVFFNLNTASPTARGLVDIIKAALAKAGAVQYPKTEERL